jgi:hypothetical protein
MHSHKAFEWARCQGSNSELQPTTQPAIDGLTVDFGNNANDLDNQFLFDRSELRFYAGRNI